jgi:AAA15 family ATPase/GTPase
MIRELNIENFKSIRNINISPRRVNLIIGMPNVGKSNVLEALSFLNCELDDRSENFMSDFIRYENIFNLFYDNDTSLDIKVTTNYGQAILYKNNNSSKYVYQYMTNIFITMLLARARNTAPALNLHNMKELLIHRRDDKEYIDRMIASFLAKNEPYSFVAGDIDNSGRSSINSRSNSQLGLPKKYDFKSGSEHQYTYYNSFLQPPTGRNLLDVVQSSVNLRKDIVELFKPYGLQLVLRMSDRKFEIQKNIEGFVYTYPYSAIADTLQRTIFYSAAIESNTNSVLVFEEPETRSFPIQISALGDKIVDSDTNQFFVATHSPYLVTEILEKMLPDKAKAKDLAVFVAYYENYETKLKMLSDEEVSEIRRDAIDVFYNLDRFTPGDNPYA